jgi:hypothetical protein
MDAGRCLSDVVWANLADFGPIEPASVESTR